MAEPLCTRFFDELTEAEQQTLLAIQGPEDIKSVEVLSAWTDDHLPCIGLRLNGVEVGFWWTDPALEGLAEAAPESKRARLRIFELLEHYREQD